jgi:O-antigen/teichoic acid export membrane protein
MKPTLLENISKFRRRLSGAGLGAILFRALLGSAGIRLVGMGFGFLVGVQLARGLGVTGYGLYGFVMSIMSVLLLVVEFGLPHLITREVAAAQANQNWGGVKGVLRWANRSMLGLSIVVVGLTLGALLFFKERLEPDLFFALVVGLTVVPVTAFGNLAGAALRGLQRIVLGQLPEFVLRPAFFSLFLLLVIGWGADLTPAVALGMQLLAGGLTYVFAATCIMKGVKSTQASRLSARQEVSNWSSAFPMAVTEGVRVLNGNVAILILGLMASAEQVGFFRVALSVSILLAMPISLLHIVSAPLISRLYAVQDHARLQKMLSWTAWVMGVGVLFLMLPFLLMGEHILGTVFGGGFEQGAWPLVVLALGTLASAMFGSAPILLNMVGHERRVAVGYGISLVVVAVLTIILVPWIGAIGAAVATSVAATVCSAIMWSQAHTILKLDTSILGLIRK